MLLTRFHERAERFENGEKSENRHFCLSVFLENAEKILASALASIARFGSSNTKISASSRNEGRGQRRFFANCPTDNLVRRLNHRHKLGVVAIVECSSIKSVGFLPNSGRLCANPFVIEAIVISQLLCSHRRNELIAYKS